MKVTLMLDSKEIEQLQYPVVVEMYDKVAIRGQWSMSKRKKYLEQFTEYERDKIQKYYNLFYKWYLQTGAPQEYVISPRELKFVERVIEFFATV